MYAYPSSGDELFIAFLVNANRHLGRTLATRSTARVCKSGYPLSGYPDLSVNFMAAKNPDILVENPDIRYPKIRIS